MSDWEEDDQQIQSASELPMQFGSNKLSGGDLPAQFGSMKFGGSKNGDVNGFGSRSGSNRGRRNNFESPFGGGSKSNDAQDDFWGGSSGGTGLGDGLPTQFGSSKGGFGDDDWGRSSSSNRGRGGGQSRKCYKCNEEGHISRDCPSADNSGSGGRGRGTGGRGRGRGCFTCGDQDHMSRDCPAGGDDDGFFGGGKSSDDGFGASRGRGRGGGRGGRGGGSGCHKCGEEGHFARECTKSESADGLKDDRPPLYCPQHLSEEPTFENSIPAGINFEAYQNIPVKITGNYEKPSKNIESFSDMNLRQILLDNVKHAGYKNPTPVQKAAIPILLEGRDLMACAQTGSGKTAAYVLPILNYILENSCESGMSPALPVGVVIAPTRELAIQIFQEARKFAHTSYVKTCVLYGGTATYKQHMDIQGGCHLVVATPGRLNDFVEKGFVAFTNVKFLVLDEADRMLDMGFLGDIRKVVQHPTMTNGNTRQTLMFSATFPTQIQECAAVFLNDYVFVVVGSVGAANTDVKQTILQVEKFKKRELLIELLTDLLEKEPDEKILVFVEQKRMTDFIGAYLCERQIPATTMHGDRYQKQREEALSAFRTGLHRVLVATAVAARGLDIRGVNYVINFDLPKEVDEYVHRIGRTGRVGNEGQSISFYDDSQDSPLAKDLVKLLQEADQEVPDWLMLAAHSSGSAQTYFGNNSFGAKDIRAAGRVKSGSASDASGVFGGPMGASTASAIVDDDEEWD